jgi:hypothetical protein
MKNIFKSRFSLIAVCIVLGILIGSFALCGCRMNYGLLEGMETNTDATSGATQPEVKKEQKDIQSTLNSASTPVGVGDIASGLASVGASLEAGGDGNAITSSIAEALQTINPVQKIISPFSTQKEAFQVSKPLAWKTLAENESEELNLSTWVSDAVKYSKGMSSEDHLNSYQYNSGSTVPLPEGQLFFFKDTKFDSSCCPSTYTSSKGCACMSKKQFQYLTMRGGNNTIPNNKTSYFNEF